MFGHEWASPAARANLLRYQQFNGQPYAHIAPQQWQLDPQAIRQVAFGRGYVEVSQMYPGFMAFHFAGSAPISHYFDNSEAEPNLPRERWLSNKLSGTKRTWLSVRHAKLPRRVIESVAARHGLRVAWMFGDETDQFLLVSNTHVESLRPQAPPAGFRRVRPVLWPWLAVAMVLPLAFATGLIIYDLGHKTVGNVCLSAGLLVSLLAFSALRIFPRSTRFKILTREFNGASLVSVFLSTYKVSEKIVMQVASAYGYSYLRQNSTRAQGRYITFVKTA